MKGLYLGLLALVACLLLPGVGTLGATGTSVGAPTYFKNDYWKYSISGNGTIPIQGGGSFDFKTEGLRTLWVTVAKPGAVTMVESTVRRTTGIYTFTQPNGTLHVVAVAYDLTANATANWTGTEAGQISYHARYSENDAFSSGGGIFLYSIEASKESKLIENSFKYPLAPGLTGRTVAQGRARLDYTHWPLGNPPAPTDAIILTRTDYLIWDFEEITVPAGKFTTLPVDSWGTAYKLGNGYFPYVPDGNRTRTYYSAALGMEAKVIDYDGSGRELDEENLVEYRYVAPLGTTVASDARAGTEPFTVHLNATVAGGLPPYSFTWRFGDSATSTVGNPVHTFSAPGSYNVTVTVTDLSGQVVNQSLMVSVSPRPWYSSPPFSDPPFLVSIAGAAAAVALIATVVLRRRRRAPPPPSEEGALPPEGPGGTVVPPPEASPAEGGPPQPEEERRPEEPRGPEG